MFRWKPETLFTLGSTESSIEFDTEIGAGPLSPSNCGSSEPAGIGRRSCRSSCHFWNLLESQTSGVHSMLTGKESRHAAASLYGSNDDVHLWGGA